jgi:hypothetical protein
MRGWTRIQDVETGRPLRSRVAQGLNVQREYAFASSLTAALRDNQFEHPDSREFEGWIPTGLCSRLATTERSEIDQRIQHGNAECKVIYRILGTTLSRSSRCYMENSSFRPAVASFGRPVAERIS